MISGCTNLQDGIGLEGRPSHGTLGGVRPQLCVQLKGTPYRYTGQEQKGLLVPGTLSPGSERKLTYDLLQDVT